MPLRAITLPAVTGAAAHTRVEFSDLQVLACSQRDHPTRYATPDFGAKLIDRLFDQGDLPITSPPHFGDARCGKCKSRLPAGQVHSGRVSGVVRIEPLIPFTVAVIGPLSHCANCGLAQLVADPEMASDLCDAMLAAFASISLSH